MTLVESLVALMGPLWVTALAAEFATVLAETWGSMKPKESGEGEGEHMTGRKGGVAVFMAVITTISPALLFAHVVASTQQAQRIDLLVVGLGAVFAAMVVGSLLGWLIGAMARGAAGVMHMIGMPLGLATLCLAGAAAAPSLPWLMEALAARFG